MGQVTITEARNAVYIDADGSIDCEINHPKFGWIPYTLRDDDTDMTVNNEAVKAILGSNIAAYVPPTQEELDAQAAATVRAQRDMKLTSEVDVIAGNALRWAALDAEQRQAWADYRQALLDVPQQAGFPHEVVWPINPTEAV
jgi:hypothetical protein